MGHFRDILPSQQDWIDDLAKAEMHPDAEKLLQLGRSFDPQQLVEEATVDFLTGLRECFTEYVRIFNGYSGNGEKFQEIKIYSVAQTAADFMIYRNQVKLVVTNSAHGVINLSFVRHDRSGMPVESGGKPGGVSNVLSQSQEILAQVGPFRNVYWTFQTEKVSPSEVAKFYFAEFVRATRDSKRSRAGNQFILEQIKTLLQEKGIDL